MRWILCLVALVVAVSSAYASLAFGTLLTVWVICALPFYWTFLQQFPRLMCRWCSRGRHYAPDGVHFGRGCPGRRLFRVIPVPRSSCEGVGERLRFEVRVLRAWGFMQRVVDPVAQQRAALRR